MALISDESGEEGLSIYRNTVAFPNIKYQETDS